MEWKRIELESSGHLINHNPFMKWEKVELEVGGDLVDHNIFIEWEKVGGDLVAMWWITILL
jgi:hypothetical protein